MPGCVLGIDLRSGPRYPTGVAVLDGDRRLQLLQTMRTDEEILAAAEAFAPQLIAIDAPLALPEGRCCVDPSCECAKHGIMRELDRLCASLGYRPFPTLLPSMVGLTVRGMALAGELRARGFAIAEVYPGMAQDILDIPRKRDRDGLRRGLKRLGIRGIPRARTISHDELDAVTAAYVSCIHLDGASEVLSPSSGPPAYAPFVIPPRDTPSSHR